ncbi:metal-dependent hydrolase [Sphingomonas sp. S2-65]|uniref:metal-dependent hydrolase n=1 Tax=Sphingomonas sp. S2-65 TaxID=2903960 RepID=UPI001F22989F|nr:metal-dependent hydrolase [Sphingomonas sp. S2-65]UYY59517.1 metal-dependent hydrolase [Sphingomonas sp. S2-65]
MAKAKTPADLAITPRDRRFGRGVERARWWLNGDPVATAFYNALSVTFPKGEGFFIDSVRKFRAGTPPRLEAEINAFIKQEVIHTREHVAFNRHVTDQGYDIRPLEADVDAQLALTKDRPPIGSLAATLCLEHFTAILAHALLADPRHLEGAEPEAAAMWRWHAIEEIEHKGVAFDTWMHATKDWSRWQRWRIKSFVMLITTWRFFDGRRRGILELLRQDGLTGPRIWAKLAWYAFGNPGLARKVAGQWFAFFLPGFHPWNHDDRALINKADSDYAAAVMA